MFRHIFSFIGLILAVPFMAIGTTVAFLVDAVMSGYEIGRDILDKLFTV